MAANDKRVLDTILEKKKQIAPSLSEGEIFELFTCEQILKDYDLSYEEIQEGLVGGGGNGGIDGIFLLVNGELIEEDSDYDHFKKDINIEVFIMQAKSKDSFQEKPILNFTTLTSQLFDLSKNLDSFSGEYRAEVIKKIACFRKAHDQLASKFPKLTFNFFYATKGQEIHPSIRNKTKLIKEAIDKIFSKANTNTKFLGASDLLELARREPSRAFNLKVTEGPISSVGPEDSVSFLALVSLLDFLKFISDENGTLIKRIFEANVRDYQGNVEVNKGIQNTLNNNEFNEDFWWLNNGVTIIAGKSSHSGKTIHIDDPLIVNGLQTSFEIYKSFKEKMPEKDQRVLLVRIIVPPNSESCDKIIKATNSQTTIPSASLRATEPIHRNIEDFLKPNGIFYDRRKNYYKNQGQPLEKIIGIGRMAQAVISCLLKRPN
ncbi:MAG: AIPR family protein, partial [Nitrospinales bacterium]